MTATTLRYQPLNLARWVIWGATALFMAVLPLFFTQGFAITRHGLHGFRVHHFQIFEHVITHALADEFLGIGFFVERHPVVLRRVEHRRSIDFGQAIGVGDVKAVGFHRAQDGGGRRGAGGHHFNSVR